MPNIHNRSRMQTDFNKQAVDRAIERLRSAPNIEILNYRLPDNLGIIKSESGLFIVTEWGNPVDIPESFSDARRHVADLYANQN